ncbi:MAG: phosphate ABC transporter permease PstA [Alphaproteobacteria bacterium]
MRRRYAAEKRFRLYGLVAISLAMAALFWLLASITASGYQAFVQTYIQLEISFDASAIDPKGTRDRQTLRRADYAGLYKSAIREAFPEVRNRRDRRDLTRLISSGADLQLRDMVLSDPSIIGTRQKVWLVAADEVDQFAKGAYDPKKPESERPFKDKEIAWFNALKSAGALEKQFNWSFFTLGTSREPELAGIWGAIVGSFWTMLVTLVLSFPVGVAAAIYLQEFAPKNRWTDLIEVNINNLAAVPSIVFGLLGLAVFLQFFGLPRSAPMAGGMVLALMTLPTIIIATRAALSAVPPSIREAALGVGASRQQMVLHHVLPLALPGILTGTIIGMARALGETAPLLMIGMVAFIVDIPEGPMSPSTVLPVQIFLWSDLPERAFVERTSAAILVLLGFLIAMNAIAILLRKKFERRW